MGGWSDWPRCAWPVSAALRLKPTLEGCHFAPQNAARRLVLCLYRWTTQAPQAAIKQVLKFGKGDKRRGAAAPLL